jgi:hypothetical protein
VSRSIESAIRGSKVEPKPGDALGHDHAVQPVLEIGMLVTDMDRAVAVERDAGRLHEHLDEAAIEPARLVFQQRAAELVIARAKRRQDVVARIVEPAGGNDDVGRLGRVVAGGNGLGLGAKGQERGRGHAEQERRSHGKRTPNTRQAVSRDAVRHETAGAKALPHHKCGDSGLENMGWRAAVPRVRTLAGREDASRGENDPGVPERRQMEGKRRRQIDVTGVGDLVADRAIGRLVGRRRPRDRSR